MTKDERRAKFLARQRAVTAAQGPRPTGNHEPPARARASRKAIERMRGESGYEDRFGYYPGSDNLGESEQ